MTVFHSQVAWIEAHFTEVLEGPEVVLDLKYATTDNFMKRDLYRGFKRCFLHPDAARMFQRACRRLREQHPELQFRVWDALRPRQVQARMFEFLRGGPYESYVAPPMPGSFHNYGLALDLTLQNKNGTLLEMGTDFDDFADLAQPVHEERFRREGLLSETALGNRLLLRNLLESEGFKVLPHEWWHFNALHVSHPQGLHPALE